MEAPRLGKAMTPYLDLPPEGPPARKPRTGEEIISAVISEQGIVLSTLNYFHKLGPFCLLYSICCRYSRLNVQADPGGANTPEGLVQGDVK